MIHATSTLGKILDYLGSIHNDNLDFYSEFFSVNRGGFEDDCNTLKIGVLACSEQEALCLFILLQVALGEEDFLDFLLEDTLSTSAVIDQLSGKEIFDALCSRREQFNIDKFCLTEGLDTLIEVDVSEQKLQKKVKDIECWKLEDFKKKFSGV